jgi:RimJ/RimL family protein N-acetyltransferase
MASCFDPGNPRIVRLSWRRTPIPPYSAGAGLAHVSYWVLPGARGRRIAPRALSAVTAWSFGTLRMHRVEVCHSTANVASCRVAQRAGFAAEGTKRSEARHADGWHDMHLHARLDTDV